MRLEHDADPETALAQSAYHLVRYKGSVGSGIMVEELR
jgi:hypothetical protein